MSLFYHYSSIFELKLQKSSKKPAIANLDSWQNLNFYELKFYVLKAYSERKFVKYYPCFFNLMNIGRVLLWILFLMMNLKTMHIYNVCKN